MLIGSIVNVAAILAGSTVGLLLRWGIRRFSALFSAGSGQLGERLQSIIMQGLALCTTCMGISGSLKGQNSLIMILSMVIGGLIGELLDLKKEDVHLNERWFYVRESKTDAGIREVPIAEKIVPLFEYWLQRDCEYLICTPENEHFLYRNYYDSYWTPLMNSLSLDKHRPHDTRHTCISLLTEAGVDERIIKKIVGHKGQGVTETVYTHIELPYKLEAINKI